MSHMTIRMDHTTARSHLDLHGCGPSSPLTHSVPGEERNQLLAVGCPSQRHSVMMENLCDVRVCVCVCVCVWEGVFVDRMYMLQVLTSISSTDFHTATR